MKDYQTQAILLAARDWSGADRVVTLFSREYGKITALAYGARNAKNRMAGVLQPFSHVDVAIQSGKSIDTIKQCELKQSFREIREDLTAMAYASFLAEIVAELWPEREPDPRVFALLIGAFTLITSRNPRIVAQAAAWQLLALAGFTPQLDRCVICQAECSPPAGFNAEAGGMVCADCGGQKSVIFLPQHKNFFEQMLMLDWAEPGHFTVTGSILTCTEQLLNSYLAYRMEKPLKSLSFIQMVNNTPDYKVMDKNLSAEQTMG